MKYWAFLSYSHDDRVSVDRLYHFLESYRIPKSLIGRRSRDGTVPKRLYPIFRDREELAASSDLGSAVENALSASRYLIVVCSRSSALSRWVNQEIEFYKQLDRGGRIFAFIVDGAPNARRGEGIEARECLPNSLRFILTDGSVTNTQPELLAADARPEGDGWRLARLKLVAGLIDIDLDELLQRERRRRRHRSLLRVALCLLVAMACFSIWRLQEGFRREDARQARIERWIENGQKEWLTGDPQRALAWLNAAWHGGADSPAVRYLLGEAVGALTRGHDVDLPPGAPLRTAEFSHMNGRLLLAREGGPLFSWDPNTKTGVVFGKYQFGYVENATGSQLLFVRGKEADIVDSSSGKLVATLRGHELAVQYATFSPSGKFVATAGADNTARVWSSADGRLLTTFAGHTATVKTVTFTPDEQSVVSGGIDESLCTWRRDNGSLEGTIMADSTVEQVSFDPEGSVLRVITRLGGFFLESATGRRIVPRVPETTRLLCLANRPYLGRLLVATYQPGGNTISILDAENGSNISSLEWHAGEPIWARFSDDARRVVTTGLDNAARVWDSVTGRLILRADGEGSATPIEGIGQSARLSVDGSQFLRLGAEGRLALYSLKDGTTLQAPSGHSPYAGTISFSEDGSRIFAVTASRVCLWDARTTRFLEEWAADHVVIGGISSDSSGRGITIRLLNNSAILWRPDAASKSSRPFAAAGTAMAPDGRVYLRLKGNDIESVTVDGSEIKWRTPLGRESGGANHPIVFSPRGTLVAVSDGHSVLVLEAASGRLHGRVILPKGEAPLYVAWDSDEQMIYVNSGVTLGVYDGSSGRCVVSVPLHSASSPRIVVSPSGQYLAAEDGPGVVKIWTTLRLAPVFSAEAAASFVSDFSFSARTTFLITASADMGCRIWEIPSGRLIDQRRGSQALASPGADKLLTKDGEIELHSLHALKPSLEVLDSLQMSRKAWHVLDDRLVRGGTSPTAARIPTPAGPSARPIAHD